MLLLDQSEDIKFVNMMWANALEDERGFRYYRCTAHGLWNKSILTPPPGSCRECWWIFYTLLAEGAKGSAKDRMMDKGVQAVADAAQDERHGRLDYEPAAHPRLEIRLDPNDKID